MREKMFESQKRAYTNCLRKLDNLFELKISPENSDGSLLSDEEYAKRKGELLKEKSHLEEILNDTSERVERWLDIAEKTFSFACYARYWFKNGSPEEKSKIFQALGSNLTLKDKKLFVDVKKPFILVEKILKQIPEVKPGFEPKKFALNKGKIEGVYSKNPILREALHEVRTWIMSTKECFEIPALTRP
jgi:hypothetical protein